MGLSWLGVETIFTSPFASPASQTHPLPNWPTPAALNFSWKVLN
jgi:hypothetical protein